MPADGSEQRQTAPKDPQHQAKTQLILLPACAKLAEAFIFPLRRHSAIPLRFSCRTLHKPLFTFRQACPERSRRAQGERSALWFRLKTVRAETCMMDVGPHSECSGTMVPTKAIVQRRHFDERQDIYTT